MSSCDRCAAPQNPAASFCTKCGTDLRTRQVPGRSLTARVFLFAPKVLVAIGTGFVQIFLSMAAAADCRAQRAQERGESARVASPPRRPPLMCPKCGSDMKSFGIRSVCSGIGCGHEMIHPRPRW
jgi:hypothetical protein